MNDAAEDNELCNLTIVVVTQPKGTDITFAGEATLSALIGLQSALARQISLHCDDKTDDDVVLLQGRIVNSALRIAQMIGHVGERIISEG